MFYKENSLELLQYIKSYDAITLFRHVNPDFDAFGSQFGLYYFLKKHFPHKHIELAGDFTSKLVKNYTTENIEKPVYKKLAIVCDTANFERIDGDISDYEKIIKIDHHLVIDSYGDMNIENTKASSTCEIVTLLVEYMNYDLPIESVNSLYMGIIGDSNRFLFDTTSTKTFKAASFLLNQGLILSDVYEKMYLKKAKDLEIIKYIYNHFNYSDGIAYYYLDHQALHELDITREEGSNYVNLLSNIEEFKIYCALTENVKDNNIRVSLRSRHYPVNKVARKYHGGGHLLASGCNLKSIDDLPLLLEDLKSLLKED